MALFAEHIFIRNFKSIRQVSIENCARINLILGKPNTGKSNFLEALSLFSLPFLRESQKQKITGMIRCENLPELFHFGNTKDPILSVMGFITCVVKFNSDETISVEANEGIKPLRYQIDRKMKLRFDRNEFEYPVVKRYIFPEKAIPGRRQVNYPKPPDGRNQINPMGSKSETELRINFFKNIINSNKDSILVFEEPEAHCFPPFTTEISQEMIHNRENQYFLSTYSPFMIHDLLENAAEELAIFEVDRVDFETVVRKLSQNELDNLFQKGVDLF